MWVEEWFYKEWVAPQKNQCNKKITMLRPNYGIGPTRVCPNYTVVGWPTALQQCNTTVGAYLHLGRDHNVVFQKCFISATVLYFD